MCVLGYLFHLHNGQPSTWRMKTKQQRAWKANLMVPVRDVNRLKGGFEFL